MKRIFGLFFIVFYVTSATARADLFLNSDSDIRRSPWQLSVGAGWSIPYNSRGTIPATHMAPVLGGFETPGLNNSPTGVLYGTSMSKSAALRQSTSYEGTLSYSVNPWWSVGLFGGTTGNHFVVDSTDNLNFFFTYVQPGVTTYSFAASGDLIRYGLTFSRAVPIVRIGPWIKKGNFQLRPYVTAGAGWYMVDQFAAVGLPAYYINGNQLVFADEADWRFFNQTNSYLGALLGSGVTIAMGHNGSLSIEAHYEHIFKPGFQLQFITPALNLGYHFGG